MLADPTTPRWQLAAFANLPLPPLERPVFILGCGRSGTTILGKVLSKHRKIAYLNEPRHLWAYAYPETDIWSHGARERGGKLLMSSTDCRPEATRQLGRLFRAETLFRRRQILLEKLPANNFRLDFLHAMFPQARYIYIYRNGLEVASSIAALSAKGAWFATGQYKWQQLVACAEAADATRGLADRCENDFQRGLLEWRLSTEAVQRFRQQVPEEQFFALSYSQLLETPGEVLERIQYFICLENDQRVRRHGERELVRKNANREKDAPTEIEQAIAGELLDRAVMGSL